MQKSDKEVVFVFMDEEFTRLDILGAVCTAIGFAFVLLVSTALF